MESTSLSRLLKRAEKKKLINRVPNPEDGRSVLIFSLNLQREKDDSRSVVLNFNNVIENQLSIFKLNIFEVAECITRE